MACCTPVVALCFLWSVPATSHKNHGMLFRTPSHINNYGPSASYKKKLGVDSMADAKRPTKTLSEEAMKRKRDSDQARVWL